MLTSPEGFEPPTTGSEALYSIQAKPRAQAKLYIILRSTLEYTLLYTI